MVRFEACGQCAEGQRLYDAQQVLNAWGGETGGGGGGGGGCVAGGLYCGGDKVSGDSSRSIAAPVRGARRLSSSMLEWLLGQLGHGRLVCCRRWCRRQRRCCVAGGLYCGGDKVSGDANTLYPLQWPGRGDGLGHCSDGCEVLSGQNDDCRGSGGCYEGGLYCGGDKVTGDPSTLYQCTGGSSGAVVQHCANGCAVVSGSNDRCN